MAERLYPSVPEEYADFLDDQNISPSSLLQDAIEERANEMGVELEGY